MAIFSYTVNHTAVAVRKWQRVNKSSMKSEKICLVPQRFACRCPILPRQSNLGFSFFSQVSKNKYAMCGLNFQIKAGWEAFQLTVAVWLWKPKPLGKDLKKFRMLLASLLVVLCNKLTYPTEMPSIHHSKLSVKTLLLFSLHIAPSYKYILFMLKQTPTLTQNPLMDKWVFHTSLINKVPPNTDTQADKSQMLKI